MAEKGQIEPEKGTSSAETETHTQQQSAELKGKAIVEGGESVAEISPTATITTTMPMQQAGELSVAETSIFEPKDAAETDAENLIRSAEIKGKAIMLQEEPETADIAHINPNDF